MPKIPKVHKPAFLKKKKEGGSGEGGDGEEAKEGEEGEGGEGGEDDAEGEDKEKKEGEEENEGEDAGEDAKEKKHTFMVSKLNFISGVVLLSALFKLENGNTGFHLTFLNMSKEIMNENAFFPSHAVKEEKAVISLTYFWG